MDEPRLYALQQERESQALSDGYALFTQQVLRAKGAGEFSRTPAAHSLIAKGVSAVTLNLQQWLVEQDVITANAKRKGKRYAKVRQRTLKHFAAKWITDVGPDVAAYIALKVVLDGILKRQKYSALCLKITGRILDELRYRKLKAKVPELLEWKLHQFSTSNYEHMQKSLDHTVRTMVEQEEVAAIAMPTQRRLQLGALLVEMMTGLGLFDFVTEQDHRRTKIHTEKYVEGTEETNQWLIERNDQIAQRQGQNIPMVIPPLDWQYQRRGGYHFALRGVHPLVRANFIYRYPEPEKTDMPLVYTALNALQKTPWRINESVYAVMEQEYTLNLQNQPVIPERPEDIDVNEEARLAWKRAAGKAHNQKHQWVAYMRKRRRILDTVRALQGLTFYFPYSLDFRGRVYPVADYLHPQGDDMARALLRFGSGKPLGADNHGAGWLAVHGANCMGEYNGVKMSKLTYAERVQWVDTNEARIRATAKEPWSDLWWKEADDVWQFLAFCFEWHLYCEATDAGREFVSSLPVHLDGTCNGLQHFSAMLRDADGAVAVNVAPNVRPRDIYQVVADRVLKALEEETEPVAKIVLGLGVVNRKLAKRPTMTFGYGSKQFGFKRQIREYLRGLDNWTEIDNTLKLDGKSQVGVACALLARLLWEALEDTVVKTVEGMQWLQDCTDVIAGKQTSVKWKVPVTGFPVQQNYAAFQRARVSTILMGEVVMSSIAVPDMGIDKRKEVNAVSPNVIHSLDAAALMLTLDKAVRAGVARFSMVHDSYGALAADTDVLYRATREAFVELYGQDVVGALQQQFLLQTTEELPEPPMKGELDLRGVLTSQYFFA